MIHQAILEKEKNKNLVEKYSILPSTVPLVSNIHIHMHMTVHTYAVYKRKKKKKKNGKKKKEKHQLSAIHL